MDLYSYGGGIQNKNDKPDYDHMKARPIFKVDIETGEVLVDRLGKLNDRFGVMDDATKGD